MFSTTILTSWAGCPQSRLYQDVVAAGDRRSVRLLTKVARQWDHTLAPRWLVRLVPRRLQPAPFDPEEYARVVGGLPEDALWDTLDHVTWLRTQPCVRGSLRSVAFLESFETVVTDELEHRCLSGESVSLLGRAIRHLGSEGVDGPPPAAPPAAQPGSGTGERPEDTEAAPRLSP